MLQACCYYFATVDDDRLFGSKKEFPFELEQKTIDAFYLYRLFSEIFFVLIYFLLPPWIFYILIKITDL